VSERLWRPTPSQPYRARDAAITSAMMARVRSKDSHAERLLRQCLWKSGCRYRVHVRRIAGVPDVVFASARITIFVDGDFWHGRAIVDNGIDAFRATLRTARREWWIEKISRTVKRDRLVSAKLEASGWTVLRFWETDVLADPQAAAKEICTHLNSHRAPRGSGV
jgi:DNA mismatch endonuclease (patch repair protein)